MVTVTANAEETRELMLDAAERLFAEKGIDATTVSEIHRQSGQYNKSAVHYHFGSRDGLLQALVERHQRLIEAAREDYLARADGSTESLVSALVRPPAASLATESGRRYLRIAVQLMHGFSTRALARVSGPPIAQALAPGLRRTLDRLALRLDYLEPEVRSLRLAASIQLLFEVLAARARDMDVYAGELEIDHESFVAEVEAMVVGLLTSREPKEAST